MPGEDLQQKIYIVFQRKFAVRDGRPNVRILAATLNRADAERVIREVPGTYIEKVTATKGLSLADLERTPKPTQDQTR